MSIKTIYKFRKTSLLYVQAIKTRVTSDMAMFLWRSDSGFTRSDSRRFPPSAATCPDVNAPYRRRFRRTPQIFDVSTLEAWLTLLYCHSYDCTISPFLGFSLVKEYNIWTGLSTCILSCHDVDNIKIHPVLFVEFMSIKFFNSCPTEKALKFNQKSV